MDNIDSTFYMLTNHNAPKYKLVSFSINATDANNWKTILPENENPIKASVKMTKYFIKPTLYLE